MDCGIIHGGVKCGKKSIALLDDRIPVCKDHYTDYFRGGKDIKTGKGE